MASHNGPVENGGERDVEARLLLLLLGLLFILLLRRGFVFVVFLVLRIVVVLLYAKKKIQYMASLVTDRVASRTFSSISSE